MRHKALSLLIPITKIDEERRLVYGRMTQEVADKSGEILDYESAKPEFEKWSSEIEQASDGKSKGNVRVMHTNKAAGKLTDLVFVDEEKAIDCVAKIVDDEEWEKTREGVYTGFSIGGAYKARWKDPGNPELMRFTPAPAEVSLVDNPCVPTATFEYIKAGGGHEMRKFKPALEAQTTMKTETTEKQIPQPVQVWKASDGQTFKTKAECLKHEEALLAKAITEPAEKALAQLEAALGKADDKKEKEDEEAAKADGEDDEAKKDDGDMTAGAKDKMECAAKNTSVEKSEGEGDQAGAPAAQPAPSDAPAAPAPEAPAPTPEAPAAEPAPAEKTTTPTVTKGMYGVGRLADAIECLSWLHQDCVWEKEFEGDNSKVPEQIKEALATLCTALRNMVNEETKELLDSKEAAADASDLQKATALNETLTKAIGDITSKLTTLAKEVEVLKAQPLPPKGVLRVVHKDHDGQNGTGAAHDEEAAYINGLIKSGASPDACAQAWRETVMKKALQKPQVIA